MNAAIEKFDQQFQSFQPDARKAARQSIGANQHNRPRRRNVERISDADRVAQKNVSLQKLDFFETR